jgi:DNA-directed RNA polymerase I, II, and III subunit RPABC2
MDDDIIASGDFDEYDEIIDNVDILQEEQVQQDDQSIYKKLYQQHPECLLDYIEHVYKVLPLSGGETTTYDSNHKTYPFLTKYERAHIIGTRANQLSQGSKPYILVPEHITDVKDIARMELEQKRLPFIIKRRIPNGQFEYWRLADLMILPS